MLDLAVQLKVEITSARWGADIQNARVAERQTRWLQVPVSERAWGFKSPLAHVFEKSPARTKCSCRGFFWPRALPPLSAMPGNPPSVKGHFAPTLPHLLQVIGSRPGSPASGLVSRDLKLPAIRRPTGTPPWTADARAVGMVELCLCVLVLPTKKKGGRTLAYGAILSS